MLAAVFQAFTRSNFVPQRLISGFQAPDAPVCHPKLAFICHPGRDPGSMAHNRRLQRASLHTGSRVFARDDKTGLLCHVNFIGSDQWLWHGHFFDAPINGVLSSDSCSSPDISVQDRV
jgi:hypothetical protein